MIKPGHEKGGWWRPKICHDRGKGGSIYKLLFTDGTKYLWMRSYQQLCHAALPAICFRTCSTGRDSLLLPTWQRLWLPWNIISSTFSFCFHSKSNPLHKVSWHGMKNSISHQFLDLQKESERLRCELWPELCGDLMVPGHDVLPRVLALEMCPGSRLISSSSQVLIESLSDFRHWNLLQPPKWHLMKYEKFL